MKICSASLVIKQKLSIEYHKTCLSSLCRIYSNRAQKAKDINNGIPLKFGSSYSDEIFIFYGIDVNQDDDKDIFPEKICSVCFEKNEVWAET